MYPVCDLLQQVANWAYDGPAGILVCMEWAKDEPGLVSFPSLKGHSFTAAVKSNLAGRGLLADSV
jgi:hypothetical protein